MDLRHIERSEKLSKLSPQNWEFLTHVTIYFQVVGFILHIFTCCKNTFKINNMCMSLHVMMGIKQWTLQSRASVLPLDYISTPSRSLNKECLDRTVRVHKTDRNKTASWYWLIDWLVDLCMRVHCHSLQTHQKRASDPITDGCEPPCGCWELSSGPLEEQTMSLTTEPSLQPCILFVNVC